MNNSTFLMFKKLLVFAKPLAGYLFNTVVMGTIGLMSSIFITIFGAYAILHVFGVETSFSGSQITWILIAATVILSLTKYAEQLSGHFVAFKLLAQLRDEIFKSLRKLAPAKLETKEKGNMLSIITTDIELIEVFYAHTIAPVIMGAICSIIMSVYIGTFHPVLGIIAFLGYIIVGFGMMYINIKFGRKDGRQYRNQFGELNSFLLESLRGLREVIQYGIGAKRCKEIGVKSLIVGKLNKSLKNREGNEQAITDAIILSFGLIMLFASAKLYEQQLVGFEAVVICTIAMLSSFGPVVALSSLSNSLLQTMAASERVLSLLEEQPVVTDIEGKTNIDAQQFNGMNLTNLTFSYDDNETIVDNVNLSVSNKEIVGIHGPSGSGKSTLLKLMMRFWSPTSGEITIKTNDDTVSLEDVNTASLRKLQSLVTQETYLFHDTIKGNLKLAKMDATDEEIIEACKKASIHSFIESLPNGYDTQVAELGSSLSGGEKQRIGLARAFLHDCPIMLLDEPTSNLDSLNEGIILKALKEEVENKTVIIVSHRKSTMNISDKIFQMNSGRVS